IVWAASRMSADLNRLGQTLAEFAIPDTQIDKNQLQMRADIVRNRLNVMRHGEFLEFTNAIPAQGKKVIEVASTFEIILKFIENPTRVLIPDILDDLSALQATIGEIVSAAREYNGEQEQRETASLLNLHTTFSAIVVMLIVFGCIMLLTAHLQNKLMKKSHDKLKEVADNLQKTTV